MKLVAVSALLVTGLAAALLVEVPRAISRQAEGWLVSRALGMGRLVGRAVEAAVDFDDAAAAAAALAAVRDDPGVVYAVLVRPGGGVIAAWPERTRPPPAPAGTDERAEVQGGLLRVRLPVVTRGGRSAQLLLGFNLTELEVRRREAREAVLVLAALFLVAGLAVSVLVAEILTRPLLRLTEAARRVATGHDEEALPLPEGRGDETGVLAAAFRQMLDRLAAQQRQIGTINEDLARSLAERTRDLERTNTALAELARTQEQLVMADRRVTIGRLAAGVAHEINNPLAFVSGNLGYVADQLPLIEAAVLRGEAGEVQAGLRQLADAVADTREGATRVAAIVRGLRTFARDDEDRREPVELEQALDAALAMARHEITHRAQLERRVEARPVVLGSEVRLCQVFLNLLVNAAHAIPEGASERNVVQVTLRLLADGRACVEVRDTGTGITPEQQGRIFDPFFTTKRVGEGTGLGLSISRNIVERMGGDITFESTPGEGSTFRVRLPLAPARPAAAAGAAALARPALPAGLRLLVVDDEPLVGVSLQRALQAEAEVVVADGGRAALARLAAGERFDWVLCDVMMPDLSGPDLLEEVAHLHPELVPRFVFMTGGAFSERGQDFLRRDDRPCLEKPIDVGTLRSLLHVRVP